MSEKDVVSLCEQAFKMSCDDQFRLARMIAGNVGYWLAQDPSYDDDPDLALKPCPFCDGEAKPMPVGDSPGYWVECEKCHCQTTDYRSPEIAAEFWNKRHA